MSGQIYNLTARCRPVSVRFCRSIPGRPTSLYSTLLVELSPNTFRGSVATLQLPRGRLAGCCYWHLRFAVYSNGVNSSRRSSSWQWDGICASRFRTATSRSYCSNSSVGNMAPPLPLGLRGGSSECNASREKRFPQFKDKF